MRSVLLCLDFVCAIFQEYGGSFQLDHCRSLLGRVEYVGHNLTSPSYCSAQSKFNLINHWSLPFSGQSIYPFVGLTVFYNMCASHLGLWLKLFRNVIKEFFMELFSWHEHRIISRYLETSRSESSCLLSFSVMILINQPSSK